MTFKAQRNEHGAWLLVHTSGRVLVAVCEDRKHAQECARKLSLDPEACQLAENLFAILEPGRILRVWRLAAIAIFQGKHEEPGVSESWAYDLFWKGHDLLERDNVRGLVRP